MIIMWGTDMPKNCWMAGKIYIAKMYSSWYMWLVDCKNSFPTPLDRHRRGLVSRGSMYSSVFMMFGTSIDRSDLPLSIWQPEALHACIAIILLYHSHRTYVQPFRHHISSASTLVYRSSGLNSTIKWQWGFGKKMLLGISVSTISSGYFASIFWSGSPLFGTYRVFLISVYG